MEHPAHARNNLTFIILTLASTFLLVPNIGTSEAFSGDGGNPPEIAMVQVSARLAEDEKSKTQAQTVHEVVLTDGSVVEGRLKGEFDFQTELGTLKVKGEDVSSYVGGTLVKGEDLISYEGGTLKLKDGTTLQGKILQKSLSIQTDYGPVEVKTENIAYITSE